MAANHKPSLVRPRTIRKTPAVPERNHYFISSSCYFYGLYRIDRFHQKETFVGETELVAAAKLVTLACS